MNARSDRIRRWRVGIVEGSDGNDDGGGTHSLVGVLLTDYPNHTKLCR